MLSPAVPYDLPMLDSARERGIPVIGEVELASYFLKGPVIGITGSNGKTTTTALTGHLLEQCGIACQVGGNIGRAVTSLVDSSAEQPVECARVVEFSTRIDSQLSSADRGMPECDARSSGPASHV